MLNYIREIQSSGGALVGLCFLFCFVLFCFCFVFCFFFGGGCVLLGMEILEELMAMELERKPLEIFLTLYTFCQTPVINPGRGVDLDKECSHAGLIVFSARC